MLRAAALFAAAFLAACGGDETSPGDASRDGASDGAVDASTPPRGDRLGYYGPAPSYFELFGDDAGATIDAFHFGRYRTGFTWPVPFAGDFDGDGYDEVGFYDPRARMLHRREGDAESVTPFGLVSGLPLAGDWDGDGVDTMGLYDPRTGRASLFDASGSETTVNGPADRFAFAADLDGDGIDGLVYFDGAVFEVEAPATRVVSLDLPENAYPFAVDADGDGVDGVGVLDLGDQRFLLFDDFRSDAAPSATVEPSPVNWVRFPVAGRWPAPSATAPVSTGYAFDSVDPSAVSIDGAALRDAERAFAAMPNLRSFLVLKDGALAHEAYFHGNRPEIAHAIKSVSKSILGTLVVMALSDGTLADVPIVTLLPTLDDGDPRRGRILWRHLLTMTSGLAWSEDAVVDWFATDDWVRTAFSAPMTSEPGSAFVYSTGNTHVASAILSAVAGRGTDEVAREWLLEPLGIEAERWDRDLQGNPVGGAEVTMRPRDLARFGQLFLEDGAPGGVRIVDREVIDAVRTEYVAASAIDGDLRYAAWWWMRSFGGADAYFAWGHGGQLVFVFPTLDAVIVVTSRSDVDGATNTAVSYSIFSVIADYVVPAFGG